MQLGVGGIDLLHFSHPGILPQGQPGAVGEPAMRRPGTKSKCPVLSWSGTGPKGICSCCMFFVVIGFYGGNPGEHGENMQTPHRKAREQAPTCCTMRDLNPQPSCCEELVDVYPCIELEDFDCSGTCDDAQFVFQQQVQKWDDVCV